MDVVQPMTHLWCRYLVACATIAAMAGCGSSPAAPSPSPGPAVPPSIPPGAYSLTVSVETAPLFVPLFCVDTGLPLSSGTATFPVAVEQSGSALRVRPVGTADLGLVVDLEPAGSSVFGHGVGQARDPQTGVTVAVSRNPAVNAAPVFSGQVTGSTIIGNPILGLVDFTLNNVMRSCAVNDWSLQPR